MGIISATRRQQSRDEWTVMAAIGEFARRAGTGVEGEFAADELAARAGRKNQQSAAGQMDFATEVAKRLPQSSLPWPPGRSTRFTCGSSKTRPASCPTPTPPGPTRSWPRPPPA